MKIEKKVFVISGAGSGIGRACAIEAAKLGAYLAISDIDGDRLQKVAEEIKNLNAKLHSQILDVTDWAAYQSYATAVHDHYGQVDIVLNNAGIALGEYSVENVPIEDFRKVMDINFWGMVYGTKAFLPYVKSQSAGTIANISSILGLGAIMNNAPYCSSKFGIRGFTEALRMEAMHGFPHVRVLSIHPGGIQTNIARDAQWHDDISEDEIKEKTKAFEKSFINTATYAAKTIIDAIKSDKERLLIGKDAKDIWRVIRWWPVSYTKKLLKYLKKENLID
jgi:Short-chain alcohol dehydrogenase of unknown specificity